MDELGKRLAALADKYGQNVIDSTLAAVRVEVYSTLMAAAWVTLIGFGLAWLAIWIARKDDWDSERFIIVSLAGGIAALLVAIGIWQFIDPWTWAALNQPELWIAKKVVKL
jgi:O-antigen/teichoic acid export membrane protein